MGVLSAQLPVPTPPTSLDECFFNSLVVGLPYSLIFWQFWLFFVFKFVVVFLLVVQGGRVYLPTPPPWLEVLSKIFFFKKESCHCFRGPVIPTATWNVLPGPIPGTSSCPCG